MSKKIIKTGGYCCDGCQWNFCDFYKIKSLTQIVIDDNIIVTDRIHLCEMFNCELIHGSLNICNHVYGKSYEGNP